MSFEREFPGVDRVLVVDDKPETLVLLRELLAKRGYQVETAKDAEEARRVIEARPPDLILLDVVMPGTSGYELCRELKDRPNTQRIPVILLTGLSDRDDRVRGLEAGADDFLSKPLYPEELFARIKSSLKIKKLSDSLQTPKNAIEFYSCFISYSSKDHEIAKRLYQDLQVRGIRCWFAPEDLKIGEKLRPAFDEAIRLHDKVLVLLSDDSVRSDWVEKEVETAFEQERNQKRIVLFPIDLDSAVMKTDQAWAADIRRTRHIGDFRNWKEEGSYEKALTRLIRDLKAENKTDSA